MASSLDATTKRRPENFSKEISNASDTLRHKDEKWFWSKSTNRPIVGHDLSRSDTPPSLPPLGSPHSSAAIDKSSAALPFFSLKFEFFVEKFGRKSTRQVVAWWCVCTLTHTHPPTPPPPFNGRWPSRMAIIPFLLEIYSNKLQEKSSFLWKNAKKSGKMAKVFRKFVLIF